MRAARWTLKNKLFGGAWLAMSAFVGSAEAYDISTHALIAEKAYQRSVLNPSDPDSVVNVLGFDRLDPTTPFVDSLFDNQATSDVPTQFTRFQQPQETSVFRALIDANRISGVASVAALQYRVDGWLIQGDVREDDNDLLIPFTSTFFTQDKRDPDPWGDLLRAGRHFYDPIYDRAFSYPTCDDYGCVRSPVWAMGTQHPLTPPGDAEDTARRNHFSWVDARNNYWKALTKERYPNGGTLVDRVSSSVERQQRWSTTIASLGHVIHLLQDGAQPQHTRNDSHAPPWVSAGHNAPNGAAYEAFTNYRVLGNAGDYFNNPIREMNDNLPSLSELPPLVFDGYPIPTFSQPVKFFTTRYENPGSGNGAGSNRSYGSARRRYCSPSLEGCRRATKP